MSSLPSTELLDPIFDKADLTEGFKVIWYVINNFFVSFDMSCGPYNLSQNTLRRIREISFMESLIADFIQIFVAVAKFLFLQGRLGTRLFVHSIS